MRLTDFWDRMRELLGPVHAEFFASMQVLSGLNNRTVEQALADGEPAKDVWRVVCDVTDAPARLR